METNSKKDVKNPPDDVRQDLVKITVDDRPYNIHRGRRAVSEIKEVGQVPLAYTLVLVDGNKLTPLPDNGFVVIKGDEEFKSHPKDGGNS